MPPLENAPPVAAVVVNWNRCELLLEALRSLAKSDYSNLKVIVVDNGSDDGSAEAAAKEFPAAVVIRSERNLGFAAGNNLGMERALAEGAEFIFLLNNDATVAENTIRLLIEFMAAGQRIGGAAPFIFYHDRPNLIWFGGGTAALWRGWIGHQWLRRQYKSGRHTPRRSGYLTGCALLLRARALKETGLFDQNYGLYSEDVDLSLRLRRSGWELWVVPEARVWHRISASSAGEFTPIKAFHRGRSNALLVRRYIRRWQIPTLMVGGILTGGLASLKLLLTGRGATALHFWRGVWAGLTVKG